MYSEKMLKSGDNFNIVITASGEVYSWGDNEYGQLGLGNHDHQNIPQQVDFFKDKQIKEIKCGGYHTIAITEIGQVYSWGENNYGQLGLGHQRNQNIPQQVEFFKDKQIKKIKCSRYYTIAITENCEIYSWGNNSRGQLGLGNNNHQNIPQQVDFFKDKPSCMLQQANLQIKKIKCGRNHTFAITNIGEIYSWGYNDSGQLALGHQRNQNIPQQVDFFKDKQIKEIICGGYHTFAITENGEVYYWGYNNYGELGLSPQRGYQNVHQQIEFFKDKQIKKIKCGLSHIIAITENGEIYSWGDNYSGQLGLGNNDDQNVPQLIDFFKDKQIKKILCGDRHTIAITDIGEVYSWGYNYFGQLGLGFGNNNQNIPHLVEFFKEHPIITRISNVKSARSATFYS